MSSPQPSTSLAETVPQAIAQDDLLLCQRHIAHHSKSFYLSSLLLPRKVRYDAWRCMHFVAADDAVDGDNPGDGTVPNNAPGASAQLAAVANLRKKLAAVYRGDPGQGTAHAIDRAFSKVVVRTAMPQALPSRLLDGMEQDARGQHYGSWEDLYGYCFNVAATVGLMMTCVMGHKLSPDRLAEVLLRASDLGVAMQHQHRARRGRRRSAGSGVSAGFAAWQTWASRRGRSWRKRCRIAGQCRLARCGGGALATADAHYAAAEVGIAMLPDGVQWAIRSASRIYQRIGRAQSPRV